LQTLSAAELASLLPYGELVAALRDAFAAAVVSPERHRHLIASSSGSANTLLLMPAWVPGGFLGVKIATVCPDNSSKGVPSIQASYLLTDAETGEPLSLMDGVELTMRRTAATSALAAGYLARPDSANLLIVGTGALASYMGMAHCAALPIKSVRVWGRDSTRAQALASQLRSLGAPDTQVIASLQTGCEQADLITCATGSTEALVKGAWLHEGQHLDLVGGHSPQMHEADTEAVRCSRLFVDTRSATLAESGEIIAALRAGAITEAHLLADMAELCGGKSRGRTSASEITLFKSVGLAVEDLAAATLAFRKSGEARSR